MDVVPCGVTSIALYFSVFSRLQPLPSFHSSKAGRRGHAGRSVAQTSQQDEWSKNESETARGGKEIWIGVRAHNRRIHELDPSPAVTHPLRVRGSRVRKSCGCPGPCYPDQRAKPPAPDPAPRALPY